MALEQQFQVDAALNELVAVNAPLPAGTNLIGKMTISQGGNDAVVSAAGELSVQVTQPLPAGTNLIGSVNSRTEDGAGTAITSTLVSGKQGLDVNVISSSAVPTSGIATLSNIAQSNTSAVALATNASRKGFYLYNDAGKAAFIAFAATSSLSAYTFQIGPQGFFEDSPTVWTGNVSAIWASAGAGKLYATELT